MREGLAKGSIYSGEQGQVTISASIQGIGSTQKTIIIGPVEIGEYDEDEIEASIDASVERTRVEHIEDIKPNWIKIWTYPNPTSGKTFGILAAYNVNFTSNVVLEEKVINENEEGDEEITIENKVNENTLIIPIKVDGRSIIVSDNGLEHESPITLTQRVITTHAVEFEINASEFGEFDITATGPGLTQDTTKLIVTQESGIDFEIKISPLPIIIGQSTNIAFITIIDKQTQAIIDLKKTFGGSPKISVNPISGKISNLKTIPMDNGWRLVGDVEDTGIITASIENIGLVKKEITPGGIPIDMEVWMPKLVHVGESFPYTIHEKDIFGNTIGKTTISSMSAPTGVRQEQNNISRLIIDSNGEKQITFLGEIGVSTTTTEAFLNNITMYDDMEKTKSRFNEIVMLEIETIPKATITIDTTVDVTEIGEGVYEIKSDEERNHEIVVTAKKTGYTTITKTLYLDVKNEIDFTINAEYEGIPLQLELKQTIVNGTTNIITPYHKIVKAGIINLEFPKSFSQNINNFEFTKATINGKEQKNHSFAITATENTEINVEYARLVSIKIVGADVVGPNGIGSKFPINTPITITAYDKPFKGFLEREVFDEWEGIHQNIDKTNPTINIVASENMDGRAIYKKDSSLQYGLVGIIITIVAIIVYGKKKGGINRELIDSIIFDLKNMLKFNVPKLKKSKKEIKNDE